MPRKKTRHDLPSRKPMQYRAPLPDAEIIRPVNIKHVTGFSLATALRLEKAGKFPPRVRLSDNAVGWTRASLDAWKQSRQTA